MTQQSSCIQCDYGQVNSKIGSSVSSDCIDCQAGYYADSKGTASCIQCPEGTYSLAKSASCIKCPQGTANPSKQGASSAACKPCAAGHYADSEGKLIFINFEIGMTTCLECNPGSYSQSLGAITCKLCLEGKHANTAGLTACVDCNEGYYSSEKGSSE